MVEKEAPRFRLPAARCRREGAATRGKEESLAERQTNGRALSTSDPPAPTSLGQKVGDERRLYIRKLRGTPKARPHRGRTYGRPQAGATPCRTVKAGRDGPAPLRTPSASKGRNGRSAAKPSPSPPRGEPEGRFRDYNRMGASLRYSPLPRRKACRRVIKGRARPLGPLGSLPRRDGAQGQQPR